MTSRLGSVWINGERIPRYKQIAYAQLVCFTCPVKDLCLQWVTEHPEPEGIWAGTLPDEREPATDLIDT